MTSPHSRNPQAVAVANSAAQITRYSVVVTAIDHSRVGQNQTDPMGIATTIDSFGKYRQIGVSTMVGSGAYPQVGEQWIVDQSLGAWTFLSRQNPVLPVLLMGPTIVLPRSPSTPATPPDGGILYVEHGDLYFLDPNGVPNPLTSPPPNFEFTVPGPITLAASAAWVPLPAPGLTGSFTLNHNWLCQICVSAYIDTVVNNNQINLDFQISGANSIAPGSPPQNVLRVGGKSETATTASLTTFYSFLKGTSTITAYYTAQAAGGLASYYTIDVVGVGLLR